MKYIKKKESKWYRGTILILFNFETLHTPVRLFLPTYCIFRKCKVRLKTFLFCQRFLYATQTHSSINLDVHIYISSSFFPIIVYDIWAILHFIAISCTTKQQCSRYISKLFEYWANILKQNILRNLMNVFSFRAFCTLMYHRLISLKVS